MNSKELIEALEIVAKEKDIEKEVIFNALEESLTKACKKYYETLNKNSQTRYPGTSYDFGVDINRKTGKIDVYMNKTVVESYEAFAESEEKRREEMKALAEAEDSDGETKSKKKDEKRGIDIILLEDARNIEPTCEVGDVIRKPIKLADLNRISAQTAKQVVFQKVKEAEREKLYNYFAEKEFEVETGIIQREDEKNNVIVSLGKLDAILPAKERVDGETYKTNDRIKVYILEVKNGEKGPKVKVSRKHPGLVKRLFEQEVPEVKNGDVEIKSIAREAGKRTKIAVYAKNPDLDPVGTCVGEGSSRVRVIVSQLNNEKIDIVKWSENQEEYIAEALSPAKVLSISTFEEEKVIASEGESGENTIEKIKTARVIVPENKLSLAIGMKGQNVRLAARLTGWKIDIKKENDAIEAGWISAPIEKAEDYDEYDDDTYDDVPEDEDI